MTLAVNALAQKSYVTQAANKWGVPYGILAGVYGMETQFGYNVNTSSAGAIGPFQFEPGTAQEYNYPLTNNPTPQQFQQQADAAAHYLHDLYNRNGQNWDSAIRGYGGGYGLAQVNAKAQSLQSGLGAYYGGVSPLAAIGASSAAGLGAVAGLSTASAGATAGETAVAGDTAATDVAAGAGAGGIASKLSNLSNLGKIKSTLGTAALISALLDPKHLLRILMVIGGIAVILITLVFMLKSQMAKAR